MTTQTTRLSLADLVARGPVVVDGGMGTLLQDRGLVDGGSGELWNVERPEAVRDAHEQYAAAGARILTTNTFGGTRARLEGHGLGDRVHELQRGRRPAAREVAEAHGALVAGDLGPTGELMAPLGTLDAAGAQALFAEQLAGLRDGGIDLVLIETMSDLSETLAAVAAAREVVPDLPVLATLSFDTNLHTMMRHRSGRSRDRARGGRGHRRRCQLRARAGGDGADRRGDGGGASRGRAPRGPVQRRAAARGRRPLRVRRHPRRHGPSRRCAARAGRRPDRGLLRLDTGAHRGDARRSSSG